MMLAGCHARDAGNRDASQRFRQAWRARQGGDDKAYTQALEQIEHNLPDSRVARKASMGEGRGPGLGTLIAPAMMGIVAAVTVPSMTRFLKRAAGQNENDDEAPALGLPFGPPKGRPGSGAKGWEPLKKK
jgi:hypothetical protein